LEHKPERQKLAVTDLVSRSFKIVMVVLYVIVGTTIIFKAVDITNVDPLYARIFGGMMIVYGIIRGIQVYRNYFSDTTSEE
jgi:hypothetical protein